MRILALDYGRKRIGAAICDESQTAITNLPILKNNAVSVWKTLQEIILEKKPKIIVVGFPGTEGTVFTPLQKEILQFVKALKNKYPHLHITTTDESATSLMADNYLEEMYGHSQKGKKLKKKQSLQDSLAAHILLRRYLENV